MDDDAYVGHFQAVARDDVLWTRRDRADQILENLERNVVAGPARRVGHLHAAVRSHRSVLEQIERLGDVERRDAVQREARMHVVEAIAVTFDVEVDGEARVVAGGPAGGPGAAGVPDAA